MWAIATFGIGWKYIYILKMIKFNKTTLFFLFAASLFFFGIMLSSIIDEGFKEGKDLFYQLGLIIPALISAFSFGTKLFKKPKN